jgi:uncharacterized protein with HEPN domain
MKSSTERDIVRISHILDALGELEEYLKNADFENFLSNSMLHSACIRQLLIVGEASAHISEATQEKLSDIEWREIIGLRNILIHEYFGIDLRIVWEVITNDIPRFKTSLDKLIISLK